LITLIPRDRCLRENPVLAHELRALQAAFDPERQAARYGGEADPEDVAWFAAVRDDIPETDAPPFSGQLALELPADDLDGLAAGLPDAAGRLLGALGGDALTLLHFSRSARWPSPRRSPPQLAEAGKRLRAFGAGKGFNGGIRADRDSLAEVLVPVFWYTRLDAGYGEVHFGFGEAPVVGTLCKYGNLHCSVYGEEWPERARRAAVAAGFHELAGTHECRERFGVGGRIEGRMLRL
jgi:hypothetical protein